MTDDEFIAALESCTLPASEFGHAAHVRAGYHCLCRGSFGQAVDRIELMIRRYASALGKPDRYHETITVAFLALIRERLIEHGDGGGWEGFAACNPDLLDKHVLLRFYPQDQLDSPLARRVFVLPRA